MRRPSPEPALPPPSVALRVGLATYLLLILVPVGLKLAGLTRLANWSWWWVTVVLWLPWVVVVGVIVWVLVVRLWKGNRV